MKIAIMGYSGAGKSTLARRLGELYHIPVLHFDTVQFLPNWQVRDAAEKARITEKFMDENPQWIIDGTYSKLFFERRTEEADEIILLLFNRFACLRRVFCRYQRYKNSSRPDMTEGCREKLDAEFIRWVLWGGRSKDARRRFRATAKKYAEKVTVIRNQRQLDRYLEKVLAAAGHTKE